MFHSLKETGKRTRSKQLHPFHYTNCATVGPFVQVTSAIPESKKS